LGLSSSTFEPEVVPDATLLVEWTRQLFRGRGSPLALASISSAMLALFLPSTEVVATSFR